MPKSRCIRIFCLKILKFVRLIAKELPNAGVSSLEIERAAPNQVQVTIHTAKPGIVIGRKGASVKELRGKLRDLTDKVCSSLRLKKSHSQIQMRS